MEKEKQKFGNGAIYLCVCGVGEGGGNLIAILCQVAPVIIYFFLKFIVTSHCENRRYKGNNIFRQN